MKSKTLLIILNEDILTYIEKGEVIERYYNPMNLFDEIIFIILTKKTKNIDIQRMVGKAKYKIYYIDINYKLLFLSYFTFIDFIFLNKQFNKIFNIVKDKNINVIRAIGMGLNFYFANKLAKVLNKPYLLSLHNQFDELKKIEKISIKKYLVNFHLEQKTNQALKEANLVIGVYSPIEWYVNKLGIKNYKTIYNVINPKKISIKNNYQIRNKFRIINVGRQIIGRDISNIIRAVSEINDIEFLVIGDGEYHDKLISLSKKLGIYNRKVFFKKSVSNDDICEMLPNFDCYVGHSEYAEIAKSTMEAMLTGLPILFNKRQGKQVKEMEESGIILVDNKLVSYKRELSKLKNNYEYRIKVAKKIYGYANSKFNPRVIENEWASLYYQFLGR